MRDIRKKTDGGTQVAEPKLEMCVKRGAKAEKHLQTRKKIRSLLHQNEKWRNNGSITKQHRDVCEQQ